MKLGITIAFCFFITTCFSQSFGDSSKIDENVFYSTQVSPKFPGGLRGYYTFVANHLKMPGQNFSMQSIKTVDAEFLLSKEGDIIFGRIVKGLNSIYNAEVLKMLQKMPRWTPAFQNGRPVKTILKVSFLFPE